MERRNIMFKLWFKKAGVRALKTVCQSACALIGTSLVISDVDWVTVASASVLAGILSLLTSVAGLPEIQFDEDEVEALADTYTDNRKDEGNE